MSGIDVTIALPEDETPGELIKGYFTLMRAFGWDLYVTSHFALKEQLGANWFVARLSELKQSDPVNWRPNYRFEPQDPGVILRDYVHEDDSPYAEVFGTQFQKQAAAKKILATRNTWFHFGDDPTTSQLEEAAKVVRAFVHSSNMHIAGRIDYLIERLSDLRSGRYQQNAMRSSVTSSAPAAESPEFETPRDLPRPRIGGTWVGDIPLPRYRITRTGDVVHPDTMESVRTRVIGDFKAKVEAWTAVEPRGQELWIDTDGAVGGFIGATPRLLGYLGEDPASEIARGFFTPNYYSVSEDEVIDLDSGRRHTVPAVAELADGELLRRTTYGDLISVSDGGFSLVATVSNEDWLASQHSENR